MWQPPPPRRRNRALPYILAAVAVLFVATAVLGFFLLRKSDEPTTSTAAPQGQTTGQPGATTPESAGGNPTTAEDEGTAKLQAGDVNALLDDMAASRGKLSAAISPDCDADAIRLVRDERQDQLRRAEALSVDALDNGDGLKQALTEALRASIESNELYLDYAPSCPGSAATDANNRASRAKRDFVALWNPVATEHGLPERSPTAI
jgi:hypothetical protein